MPFARTLRPFLNSKARLSHTSRLPALTLTRHYAADGVKTAADGASDKSPQDAEPKILDRSPPKEHKASEEVQQHNEEMQNRADKPSEHVKEEDIEKDKVSKGFWKGNAGTSE